MINKFFLDSLEYSISRALAASLQKEEKAYWCDGIIVDDLDKAQEVMSQVLRTKSLKAVAIIPKGQYEEPNYRFHMNILFGKDALSKLKQERDLDSAIPESSNSDWITLDLTTKS